VINFIYSSSEFFKKLVEINPQTNELKEQLENWIGQHLTIENVSSLFVVSDRCNALKLKKQCHKFIQKNYEKVKQTPEYQEIVEVQVLFSKSTSLMETNFIYFYSEQNKCSRSKDRNDI
jgi:hypothetical protein